MIQIISYSPKEKYQCKQITTSSLAKPQSLDEFDINIIDLRDFFGDMMEGHTHLLIVFQILIISKQ